MKKLFTFLLLIIPLSASAQQWTPEEMEVIQFIDNCQSMWSTSEFDTWFDGCWHEDIIYVAPSLEPTSAIKKEHEREYVRLHRAGVKKTHRQMTPISVKVYGDTAVIYYFVKGIDEMNDGETVNWRGLRSETVIKLEGKWKVINKNDWPYPSTPSN